MSSVFPESSNRIKYIHRSFKRESVKGYGYKPKYTYKSKRPKWKKIIFPDNIRLIEQPNEALQYFNLAYDYFRKNNYIIFDLSNVSHFSPESIALFTACIADKKYTNEMHSTGNLPKSYILKKLFLESGFFDHVQMYDNRIQNKTKSNNRLLHNSTDNEVETEIAKDVCLFVKNEINAEYIDDLEPLYVILIEAMQNTNNHASTQEKLKYDWWLYRYEDKGSGIIHFTFLDIGIGVFNSLSVRNWKRRLLELSLFRNNLDLIDDLLDGKIISRTMRTDRGKGIPQIYESSKDDLFNDFYILSNNVLIDVKKDSRTLLKEEFHGTMYYWTIKSLSNGN